MSSQDKFMGSLMDTLSLPKHIYIMKDDQKNMDFPILYVCSQYPPEKKNGI